MATGRGWWCRKPKGRKSKQWLQSDKDQGKYINTEFKIYKRITGPQYRVLSKMEEIGNNPLKSSAGKREKKILPTE
jgi:hypothetical protein